MKYLFIVFLLLSGCFFKNKATDNPIYKRKKLLNLICEKLNDNIKYYSIDFTNRYYVENENFCNFFIYDLVDTLNYSPNSKKKRIIFEEKHVYHIAALNSFFKISMIMILYKGKIYFFESLNCKNSINSIQDVINFIEANPDINLNETIIKRIIGFKQYHLSHSIDEMSEISICE
jgi:hypothetical protein